MSNNWNLIKKGDVLWVPYRRDPLWPALVQNVYPKKVTFVFFPLPPETSFRANKFSCHPKATFALIVGEPLPFDSNNELKEAYACACNYLSERGLQRGSDINGRTFSINGENHSIENSENVEESKQNNNGDEQKTNNDYEAIDEDEKDELIISSEEVKIEMEIEKNHEDEVNVLQIDSVVDMKEKTETDVISKFSSDGSDACSSTTCTPSEGLTPPPLPLFVSSEPSVSDSRISSPVKKKRRLSNGRADDMPPQKNAGVLHRSSSFTLFKKEIGRRSMESIEKRSRDMMLIMNDNLETWFNQMWKSNQIRLYKSPDRHGMALIFKNNRWLTDEDYDRLVDRIITMIRSQNSDFSILTAMHIASSIILPHVMISCLTKYKSIPFQKAMQIYSKPIIPTSRFDGRISFSSLTRKQVESHSSLTALCRLACQERDALL